MKVELESDELGIIRSLLRSYQKICYGEQAEWIGQILQRLDKHLYGKEG